MPPTSKPTNGYALGALEANVANIADSFREYKEDTRLWRSEMGTMIKDLRESIGQRADKHEALDEQRFKDVHTAVEKLDRARWYRLGYAGGGVAAISLILGTLRLLGYIGSH
jgi:hypothetical protein